ncbi:hypothetical protein MMC10_010482 [Thelotrema lepadinum]|nr:hypothetical protein [Thelotrema lepadinum]
MLRSEARIDAKRRNISHKRKQFANPTYKQQDYPYRLNFYDVPPVAEITLEQFEQWAIDRLRILAELESCSFRNRSPAETASHMTPLLSKYLPLSSNSSSPSGASDATLRAQRQKDHYSHFILRLAFSSTDELRRRFARVESTLFRLRWQADDARERAAFVGGLEFDWEVVSEQEKRELGNQLSAVSGSWGGKREEAGRGDAEEWFRVDWERVPELVENRRVFVKKGKAYVPGREQLSFVLAEFGARLEKALELTSRALPRLDEDDRLTPILNHLSKSFATPDSTLSDADSSLPGAPINAASIDTLAAANFPLCMRHLHTTLRKNSHLKHFGRLQYTLFLKGLGLSLDDALLFWRSSFRLIDESTFNKEYRYNVRHSYGDVGGDSNRRGKGYSPFSCQRILTEHPPGSGEAHGCPYKHFSVDNLTTLLSATGVDDPNMLRGVREDLAGKRYHIACNRVFDWSHRNEIKKAKEEGSEGGGMDTIVHPNTYFKRSYLLKNQGKVKKEEGEGMEE